MTLEGLQDAVGKTVSKVEKGLHRDHYEAVRFTFTDGTEMVLLGGGYDGYGDFIRIESNPGFTPIP